MKKLVEFECAPVIMYKVKYKEKHPPEWLGAFFVERSVAGWQR